MLNAIPKYNRKKEIPLVFRRTRSERVLFSVVFLLLAAYAVSLLIPFVWLILNSVRSPMEYEISVLTYDTFSFPRQGWRFSNFISVFSKITVSTRSMGEVGLFAMLFNTLWYTGINMFIGILLPACTGYVFSKYKFGARNFMYSIIIISMTIPVIGSSGAFFKLVSEMGIYNTPWFVVVSALGSGFGFTFFIFYGFFKNVSWNYAEAIFIDGGGHFKAFFKVLLAQAKGLIITFMVMSLIGNWNEYMTPILYLPDYPTIGSGLFFIQELSRASVPEYFAALIITTIPILVVFALASDIIMKNFTMGGLKG